MKRQTQKLKLIFGLLLISLIGLTGCVDQSGAAREIEETRGSEANQETEKEIEKEAVILATSMATVEICARLDIPLAGIPNSEISAVPVKYEDLPKIGSAMTPDMEIVASLNPEWILSPVSLYSDLQPKYETIGTEYAFLNLSSIQGMYKSIVELGILFDREEQAEQLVTEFETFYEDYQNRHKEAEKPRVLILMGLPGGAYIVATEESYVGSLVQLAGGINVYAGETKDFVNINTEDMLTRNPDIILRTSHAMPEDVKIMFAKEFEENDIWKQFRAVKEEKVYDLSYGQFGMSANFKYPEALEELEGILYEQETKED